MNVVLPLQDTHPQFSIISYQQSDVTEYRLARPKSSRWPWLILLVILVYVAQTRQGSIRLASIAIAIVHTWSGFNTIIWESAVVIPKIGVQLEVQRGFPETFITPAVLWSRSRRFIPLSSMLDIVINEGIRRWDFKYYLMITHRVPPQRSNDEYIKIAVAFEACVLILYLTS
ncbi:hypothetical protein FRC02_012002 [Tulasnella sp. 418]|nr:hypothetical protein FRC02_012002 [Tulasnella sp. 418]